MHLTQSRPYISMRLCLEFWIHVDSVRLSVQMSKAWYHLHCTAWHLASPSEPICRVGGMRCSKMHTFSAIISNADMLMKASKMIFCVIMNVLIRFVEKCKWISLAVIQPHCKRHVSVYSRASETHSSKLLIRNEGKKKKSAPTKDFDDVRTLPAHYLLPRQAKQQEACAEQQHTTRVQCGHTRHNRLIFVNSWTSLEL